MTQLIYTGSAVNLRLLAEELLQDDKIATCSTIKVSELERNRESLNNAELAQIVISITSGVTTSLIVDAIHAAVDRARDRGSIAQEQPNEGPDSQETADNHNTDDPS